MSTSPAAGSATDTALLSLDDGIARITLNRPQALNALNPAIVLRLRELLAEAADTDAVRAVIITGAGRGFCAGADLMDMGPRPDGMSRGESVGHALDTLYNPLTREIAHLPKPVVAAVNGIVAGGGVGLALSADIVIAARSAKFVQVFVPQLGLVPDMGCTFYLANLVGRARARGLAFLGDRLSADEAAAIGLIWKAVDDEALAAEADAIARRLADGPTHAYAATKRALDAALTQDLDAQLDLERRLQADMANRPEFIEGVKAFAEKRKPDFRNV